MADQDPYAAIAKPLSSAHVSTSSAETGDPYASIAKPLSPPPPTAIENVGGGLADAGGDIWGAVKAAPAGIWHAIENAGKNLVPPPAPDSHISWPRVAFPATTAALSVMLPETIKHPIDTYHTDLQRALPIVDAYEKSRASGKGVMDSLSAANEQARSMGGMTGTIAQKLDDLKKNPTREGVRDLTDTAAALAAAYGLGKAGEALLPEAENAAAATVPASTTPAAPAPTIFQRINPFRKAATVATDTSKIEPAVEAHTAKAGLAPGEAGITPKEANAQTAQSKIDAEAATRENVDKTLQDIAGQHAQIHGIPAPAAGTAARDVLTANGDALVDAGKANYKILDKYTDGKFTNGQTELKNAQQELRMKSGMTDADPAKLEANVLRAQMKLEQLFDTAVKNGMPEKVADTARTQFRNGQATLDVANDVRMANRVRAAGVRSTDPNVLENRWTARYDTGRLQQAMGSDQAAKDALTQLRATREASQVIESMPPTESKALRELIADHTQTGKFGTTTDWGKVREAFSKLPDRAARFSDVPKVEKFINDQKFYQNMRRVAAGAVGAAGVGAAGEIGIKAMQ